LGNILQTTISEFLLILLGGSSIDRLDSQYNKCHPPFTSSYDFIIFENFSLATFPFWEKRPIKLLICGEVLRIRNSVEE